MIHRDTLSVGTWPQSRRSLGEDICTEMIYVMFSCDHREIKHVFFIFLY